jgi:hypothetical protein
MTKLRRRRRVLLGTQKEGAQYENLNIGALIILKCVSRKEDGVVQTGFI